MSDHLEDARKALQAQLTELEGQVQRIRSAMEMLAPGSEEDAAAKYRRPGVHKDRISARVRSSFTPQRAPKHLLTDEEDAKVKGLILTTLTHEGMKRRELEAQILPRVSFPMSRHKLLARLKDLEDQGLVTRRVLGDNAAHTLWYRAPDQNGSQEIATPDPDPATL